MKNKEIKDELSELSPFLSNLENEKKAGFEMPANYFERFEDRLMSRIEEETALEGKQSLENKAPTLPKLGFWDMIKRLLTPKYAVGFSTGLVILVFALYTVNKNATQVALECETLMACLTTEEVNAYIITNIEEFATEDIVAVMESEEVAAIPTKLPTMKEKAAIVSSKKTLTTMDKALEAVGGDDLLDDLTDEDFVDEDEDLF